MDWIPRLGQAMLILSTIILFAIFRYSQIWLHCSMQCKDMIWWTAAHIYWTYILWVLSYGIIAEYICCTVYFCIEFQSVVVVVVYIERIRLGIPTYTVCVYTVYLHVYIWSYSICTQLMYEQYSYTLYRYRGILCMYCSTAVSRGYIHSAQVILIY